MNFIKKPQAIAIACLLIIIGLLKFNTTETPQPSIDDTANEPPSQPVANQIAEQVSQPNDNPLDEARAPSKQILDIKAPQVANSTNNIRKPPTAYAGEDFSMDELERVELEGKGSAFDGSEVTYKWLISEEYFRQYRGVGYDRSQSLAVDAKIATPYEATTKFLAPEVEDIGFIELYLVVTDKYNQRATDKIIITVHNVELENVAFFNIDMPDINLRECTEEYANEHLITFVNEITELHCNNRGIRDLTGLEYFTNLKTLGLVNNGIQNISILAKLPQLTKVNLGKNAIYDLRPLTALKELSQLNLHQNQISDVTPLTELNLLVSLNLADNKIEKPQYFGEDFQVKELDVSGNPIIDLSPIGLIVGLEKLNVSRTEVKRVFSLFDLLRKNRERYRRGISLDTLDISHNDIPCKDVETLNRFRTLKVISKGVCESKIAQTN